MSDFSDVGEFHEKFGLEYSTSRSKPHLIPDDLRDFRLKFLHEEQAELEEGYEQQDLAQIADALVDLVYVALGTAHLHGLPWNDLFAEVQRANMTKERATKAGDSKRGSAYDVIKPAGWRAPDIHGVLLAHGWPGPPLPFGDDIQRITTMMQEMQSSGALSTEVVKTAAARFEHAAKQLRRLMGESV